MELSNNQLKHFETVKKLFIAGQINKLEDIFDVCTLSDFYLLLKMSNSERFKNKILYPKKFRIWEVETICEQFNISINIFLQLVNMYSSQNNGEPVFLFTHEKERIDYLKQFNFKSYHIKRLNDLRLKYKLNQIHTIDDIFSICMWVDIHPNATEATRTQLRKKFKEPSKLRLSEISLISATTGIKYTELIEIIRNSTFS